MHSVMAKGEHSLRGLALSRLAGVHAGLSEGHPIARVLELEGVDARLWERAEPLWVDKLAEDAEGEGLLVDAYDERLGLARSRYGRRVTPLDDELPSWFSFLRALQSEDDPAAFIAGLGLRPSDLLRLHQEWSKRLASDAALRARAESLLTAEAEALPAIDLGPSRLDPPEKDGSLVEVEPPLGTADDDDEDEDEQDDPDEDDDQDEEDAPPPLWVAMDGWPAPLLGGPMATQPPPAIQPSEVALPPAVVAPAISASPPALVPNLPGERVMLSMTVGFPTESPDEGCETLPGTASPLASFGAALPFSAAAPRSPGAAIVGPRPAPRGSGPSSAEPRARPVGGPDDEGGDTLLAPSPLSARQVAALPFSPPAARADGDPAPAKKPAAHPFAARVSLPMSLPVGGPDGEGGDTVLAPSPLSARQVAALPFSPPAAGPASTVARGPKPAEPALPLGATQMQISPFAAGAKALPFVSPTAPEMTSAGEKPVAAPATSPERKVGAGASEATGSTEPTLSLTLPQYAALCAELAVRPGAAEATFARYGLTTAHEREALGLAWRDRLERDPEAKREWASRYQGFHAYFVERAKKG